MKKDYRKALGEAMVTVGREVKDLTVVTADVSHSTGAGIFEKKFPERFFTVGIAEANAVGIAAGISSFNRPVIFTAYSMFAAGKAFEQIRNMVCYPKLNVKIVVTHGGITTGKDGVTHQCVEDISAMRGIPGMRVVIPADPGEVLAGLRMVVNTPGPIFYRTCRCEGEVIHTNENFVDFQLGKAEILRDGEDVTLIGAGIMVWECLKAAKELEKKNIHARVINIRTVKPLDAETIALAAIDTGAIVVAEDHNGFGGLGGAVAECLVKNKPVPMEHVALKDTFAESGAPEELMVKYGLSSKEIVKKAKAAICRKGAF